MWVAVITVLWGCADWLDFRVVPPDEVPLLGRCASPDEAVPLWTDADGDGFGDPLRAARGCLPVKGYAGRAEDCDDARPTAYVGAPELCNDRDDDCDGAIDEIPDRVWCRDRDGDGFGDALDGVRRCDGPSGYVEDCGDCDDADPTVGGGCETLGRLELPDVRPHASRAVQGHGSIGVR
jgi:hypothetical protein